MNTTTTVRSVAAALLLITTSWTAASAARHDVPVTSPLGAKELAETRGGMESRITNIGSTDPLAGTLSSDKTIHFEVTSSMTADLMTRFVIVTAEVFGATGGTPVPVTVAGVSSLGSNALGQGGAVGTYKIQMRDFCAAHPGNWTVLVTATFNGSEQIRTESTRIVTC